MKIPTVAIAAAFAAGIVLGCLPGNAPHASRLPLLAVILATNGVLLCFALVMTWRNRLWLAASASLLCWVGLGFGDECLSRQPLPQEHILSRLAAQQVPLRTPLRWNGTLRGEPSRLPWGYGLEVSLESVDMASGTLPVTGGLRVGYTPRATDPPPLELHAGDAVSLFAEARLPIVYKDPGTFDRREFLARQDVHLLATLRSSKLLEKTATATPSLRWRVARLRGHLRDRLDAMFSSRPDVAAVLRAMLLGDRSFIDRSESVDFQKTGAFHVLVVAGLHVGALVFFLHWVSRKLNLARALEAFLILALLLFYVEMIEQRAPVLRASLMTAIVLLGSVLYRRLDLLNSAALAALLLLIANPDYLSDSGFLLSFLAIGCIAGIAVPLLDKHIDPFARALNEWRDVTRDASHAPLVVQFRMDFRDAVSFLTSPFRGRPARWAQNCSAGAARASLRVTEMLVLSFVLQFGMLALMARYFHRVSLLGPAANLFAVPLTGVIVPLGFFGLAIGSIFHTLAQLVVHPLTWLVILQQRLISFFAAIPHGNYRIPGPPAWLLVLFFAGLLLAALALRLEKPLHRWQPGGLAVFLAAASIAVATYPFRPDVHTNDLEVTVIDVGQGDSIFVVSPKGSTLLIDGGGAFLGFRGNEEHLGADPGEEAVSAYLWSRGFQRIDTVALTHAHQDHIGGLTAVLQNFRVSRLWLGLDTSAPAFLHLKQVATSLHVPIEQERRGQSFSWDGVQVDFLWPEPSAHEISATAKNNDSLVVRLRYRDRTILLPGDAEKQVEYTMLAENDSRLLHADVLKVGHHGSKNSTTPQFLDAVNPRISVISAGEDNPYGHPHPELLERLQEKGTRILRTDRDGAVQILTDGHSLQVSCFRACPLAATESVSTQIPDRGQRNQQ
jgi:competence protein ComEC